MPDFSKTIIYKIVHKTNPEDYDVYVGHTTNIQSRKRQHKHNCNNPNSRDYNFKIYQYIRENGGWDNFEIIKIEKYPCNSRNEASQKEQEWFYKLNAKLNFEIPNRTSKQYYEDNREKLLAHQKQYYEDNRDKILEYQKQYHQDNREKISEQQKQYRQDNCDKIKEYQTQYSENNRKKKNEYDKKRRKEKETCDNCGCILSKCDMSRHKRSKKCMNAKK